MIRHAYTHLYCSALPIHVKQSTSVGSSPQRTPCSVKFVRPRAPSRSPKKKGHQTCPGGGTGAVDSPCHGPFSYNSQVALWQGNRVLGKERIWWRQRGAQRCSAAPNSPAEIGQSACFAEIGATPPSSFEPCENRPCTYVCLMFSHELSLTHSPATTRESIRRSARCNN